MKHWIYWMIAAGVAMNTWIDIGSKDGDDSVFLDATAAVTIGAMWPVLVGVHFDRLFIVQRDSIQTDK